MGELPNQIVCRYSEDLSKAKLCGEPATHRICIKGHVKMPLCAKHVKLYQNRDSEFHKVPYEVEEL